MSAPLRLLTIAAVLIADVTLLAGTTRAANIVVEPSSIARPRTTSAIPWGGRHSRWAAPKMFVAGVRGATPLTVPFFGSNWYPGPVYYRPPPGPCICDRENALISVMY
jgi:hypothetical protein